LAVTGAVDIEKNADIDGDFTATTTVAIDGNATIGGAFTPTGAVTIGGDATITGVFTGPTAAVIITGSATFEEDFTAADAVTIGKSFTPKGDIDVSAGIFTANGTVTIADQKTITIDITTIAGAGKIVALGTTSGGIKETSITTVFMTISDGVLISNIKDAITDLDADITALTTVVDLSTNFGAGATDGIGSVTLVDADTAVTITDDAVGDASGSKITIGTLGTTLTATDAAVSGTNATDIKNATFTLSVVGGELALEEDECVNGGTAKKGVVTFDVGQLQKDGLISPVLAPFSIGVITYR
jgi:hypothetical protein